MRSLGLLLFISEEMSILFILLPASGGTLEDDSSQVLELTEYLKNFETKLTSQEQTLGKTNYLHLYLVKS